MDGCKDFKIHSDDDDCTSTMIGNSDKDNKLSLFDAAAEARKSSPDYSDEVKNIFFLGSKSSGKTLLINRFTKNNETLTPTIALEYSFARRKATDLFNRVCHIWELGGSCSVLSGLIETPISNSKDLNKMSVFTVLDLSDVDNIWINLETAILEMKKAVENCRRRMSCSDVKMFSETMKNLLAARLGEEWKNHEDADRIQPFPLALVIVGTKYDIFQSFEPYVRKKTCRLLRMTAHTLGATLEFYCKDDVTSDRRLMELLAHYAFDDPFLKDQYQCHDWKYTGKPLVIPCGTDSFSKIWPGIVEKILPGPINMDFLRQHFQNLEEATAQAKIISEDPALDPRFSEPEIDEKRRKILERYMLIDKIRNQNPPLQHLMK